MAATRRRTGLGPWWLLVGPVLAYVTFRALAWIAGEVARLAVDTGRLAVSAWLAVWWIVVVGLALVVIGLVRRAAVRGRAVVEPAEVPLPAPPLAEPAPCPYGPECPRCTGTGTIGGTALDLPARPVVEHDDRPSVEPVPLRPARRGRGRPRKVA